MRIDMKRLDESSTERHNWFVFLDGDHVPLFVEVDVERGYVIELVNTTVQIRRRRYGRVELVHRVTGVVVR